MPVQPLEAGALQSVAHFAGVVSGRPSDSGRTLSDVYAWSRSFHVIGIFGSSLTVSSGITRPWSGIRAGTACRSIRVLWENRWKTAPFCCKGRTYCPSVDGPRSRICPRMIGCSLLCNGPHYARRSRIETSAALVPRRHGRRGPSASAVARPRRSAGRSPVAASWPAQIAGLGPRPCPLPGSGGAIFTKEALPYDQREHRPGNS